MNLKFWTKLREPKARKDEVRDFYESWVKETEAIRGTLDKGMKSHQKVFMFDLYDGNRMRVLTLRMVGPRKIDDEFRTIQVSFQGVVGPCMTKYHKAYNRLIALSRLRDEPLCFFIQVPSVCNDKDYGLIRACPRGHLLQL